MTPTELYILLSDKCNFACAHCINSSGPKATRWLIEDSEIIEIAKSINENKNFESIHFSGGEPSLFLDKISRLQALITRPINYTMTTNGSFWSAPANVVDLIKIDEFILSFDRFRAPFLKQENLVELGLWLKKRKYKVLINLVVSQAEDLSLTKAFNDAGLEVLINGAILSGRYNPNSNIDDYRDSESLNRTCPSISSAVSLRGHEKIISIPRAGYTPCCGPLVFDELAPQNFSFTKHLQDYSKNELRNALQGKSFSEQAKALGFNIDKKKFNSACTACTFIYGKIGVLPSLYEMAQGLPKYKLYETDQSIDFASAQIIHDKYQLGYVFGATLDTIKSALEGNNGNNHIDIYEKEITADNLSSAVNFMEKNYYEKYREYYTALEINNFKRSSIDYFALGINGKLYFKKDKIVGCFLANRMDKHHLTGRPTVHMGYWGLEYSLLEKNEVKQIKLFWLKQLLATAKEGDAFNATVHFFNDKSINYLKKLGFKQLGLRLDLRSLSEEN